MILQKTKKICAVIWDYDGTLFDTREKNLNVTIKIIKKIKGTGTVYPTLNSVESYYKSHLSASNWRDFYRDEFNLSENEIDEAGRLWTQYQLNDTTVVPPIDGVSEVIKYLDFPQGIVSQNSKESIEENLKRNNLNAYFKSVVGYEEVNLREQKPDPAGLLICIEDLCNSDSGIVFYIGDHETDSQTGENANNFFSQKKKNIKIISIAAAYSDCFDSINLKTKFEYTAKTTDEILSIIEKFSA